jgi:hypothetical protein
VEEVAVNMGLPGDSKWTVDDDLLQGYHRHPFRRQTPDMQQSATTTHR